MHFTGKVKNKKKKRLPCKHDQEMPQSRTADPPQTHPWHREEETQNTDSHSAFKVKQPALSFSARLLYNILEMSKITGYGGIEITVVFILSVTPNIN